MVKFCRKRAVFKGKSLKEKLSNYLLVAVLQAMLAVCRGKKMKERICEGGHEDEILSIN